MNKKTERERENWAKNSKNSYEKQYSTELSNMRKNCCLVKFQSNVEFIFYYEDVKCEVNDHVKVSTLFVPRIE